MREALHSTGEPQRTAAFFFGDLSPFGNQESHENAVTCSFFHAFFSAIHWMYGTIFFTASSETRLLEK
jgi:hypothetical protein